MSKYEEFIERYEPAIRGSISDIDSFVKTEKLEEELKFSPWFDTVENMAISLSDMALDAELGFAKQVLDFLEGKDEKTIYWDLDDTLITTIAQNYDKGMIVRPAAPYLLEFLSEMGYKHGIFAAWTTDCIDHALDNPNGYNSFAEYISRELAISSKVYEEVLRMDKEDAFLKEVDSGLLILDDQIRDKPYTKDRVLSIFSHAASRFAINGSAHLIDFHQEANTQVFGRYL